MEGGHRGGWLCACALRTERTSQSWWQSALVRQPECVPPQSSAGASESSSQSDSGLERRGQRSDESSGVRRTEDMAGMLYRHILIFLSPLTILPSGDTPASPQSDYSLFLSENGHLSFENPNYQASVDQ